MKNFPRMKATTAVLLRCNRQRRPETGKSDVLSFISYRAEKQYLMAVGCHCP